MTLRKTQSGFTLIELLVVIAIIGVLAALLVVSLANSRAKARDTKRKQDLAQLAKAVELYYTNNGTYPISNGWQGLPLNGTGNCGSATYTTSDPGGYIPGLAPTYMYRLPIDPKPVTTGSPNCTGYNYWSNGKEYKIMSINNTAGGGPENLPKVGEAFYDPVHPTTAIMVCAGTTACAQ